MLRGTSSRSELSWLVYRYFLLLLLLCSELDCNRCVHHHHLLLLLLSPSLNTIVLYSLCFIIISLLHTYHCSEMDCIRSRLNRSSSALAVFFDLSSSDCVYRASSLSPSSLPLLAVFISLLLVFSLDTRTGKSKKIA